MGARASPGGARRRDPIAIPKRCDVGHFRQEEIDVAIWRVGSRRPGRRSMSAISRHGLFIIRGARGERQRLAVSAPDRRDAARRGRSEPAIGKRRELCDDSGMKAQSRGCRVALALASALWIGCGGDDGEQPGSDGGAANGPDAGGGISGMFASPDDFDRAGCSGGLGEMDPEGIWHLAIDLGGGASAAGDRLAHARAESVVADAMRIDRAAEGGFDGLLFGAEVDQVIHSDSDLFLRHAYPGRDGREIVRALTACAVQGDGSLFGRYANCRGSDCLLGSFEAHRLERLDEPAATGIDEVGRFSGPQAAPWPVESENGQITVNVRQQGGVAYVARYRDGLRIVDVSDPAAPVELGHSPVRVPDFEFYNDVKVVRGADDRLYAIAASSERGAVAIDVTEPSAPEEVATFPEPEDDAGYVDVHTLFIDGGRAYLANLTRRGLDVFDVADPRNPEPLGSYVDAQVSGRGDFVHDLHVEGERAYLNYWNLGLVAVDVSDPAAIERVGAFADYAPRQSHSNWVTDAGGRRISVHGDEGFDAHVRIIDVDEGGGGFAQIGSYQTRSHVSVHNILAAGETAYVTYYQDGLRVLDLADPQDPQPIAHFNTWPGAEPGYGMMFFEGAIGVDVDEASELIYLADTHQGLLILERSSD